MGVTTTAKRGDARSASRLSSRLKHEIIGVLLIASSLLALLSLLSFYPQDGTLFSARASDLPSSSPAGNMIGTFGATMARSLFWLVGGAA